MTLQDKFKLLCKEFNVEPEKNILDNLCIDGSDGHLDLSSSDVSTPQAAVLGNLLSTSSEVCQLRLNDCMLSENSLKALCLGLCLNTSVTSLELRGNNVRGPGTESLATLLRKNKHLRSLTLEWNNLGLSPASFRLFADALRTNRNVTSLDLRSNQLDHKCAAYLARAVAANRTLSHLDVRWNGLGVLGGRSLAEALQLNRTLTSCPVDGNALPPDLVQTIACRVRNNQEVTDAERNQTAERSMLTAQIQDYELTGRREVVSMVKTLETERASFSGVQADLTFQLGQLQEALEERKATAEHLASKLSKTEAKLVTSEDKRSQLNDQLATCRTELETAQATLQQERDQHKKAVQQTRSDCDERCTALERAVAEERSRRLQAERQLTDQRARADRLQEEVHRLQQLCATLRDDVQVVTEREELRRRTEAEAADEMRRTELAQVREQAANAYKSLQAQLRLCDEQKATLESQLHEATQRLYSASRDNQDELTALRLRLKQQEDDRCQALQTQVDHAQSQLSLVRREKHELESANQRLEEKVRQFELESRTLRSEIDCLGKEVELKQREVQGAVARVRTELQVELDKIESSKAQHQETEAVLREVRGQLTQREQELEQETRRRRHDVRQLRDELKRRETEIIRNKEDELQRAAMLHSAFRNYFKPGSAQKSSIRRDLSVAEDEEDEADA